MTYGLEWGRKVRRKEVAGKEACRIQPRLNPIPLDVERRTPHSNSTGGKAHLQPQDSGQREGIHRAIAENLIISTGSELVKRKKMILFRTALYISICRIKNKCSTFIGISSAVHDQNEALRSLYVSAKNASN